MIYICSLYLKELWLEIVNLLKRRTKNICKWYAWYGVEYKKLSNIGLICIIGLICRTHFLNNLILFKTETFLQRVAK